MNETNVSSLPTKDEASLRAKQERGRQAAEVLENPAFNEGFEALRQALFAEYENCKIGDLDAMELLHGQVRMLRNLRGFLSQAINGGKAAERDLQEMAAKAAEEEVNQRMRERGRSFWSRRGQ